MAIITALITIDTHKEEVGLQIFPDLMGYMAESIMKGLIDIQEKFIISKF